MVLQCREQGIAAIIRAIGVLGAVGLVDVLFLVVERTREVEVRGEGQLVAFMLPALAQAGRYRHTLVVLQVVARVGLGVEVIGAHVQGQAALGPLQVLGGIQQFGAHIGLEAELQVVAAPTALDFHQSTGQVAVFHRRDAAHDFHTLDVIGRDAAHVHAGIGVVTGGGHEVPGSGQVLHVGIGRDGSAVDDEAGAQRRGGVVAAADGNLADVDVVGGAQRRVMAAAAGQQFQQIGKTRGLQVLHRVFLDARRRGQTPVLLGGDDHLAQHAHSGLQQVTALAVGDGHQCLVANRRNFQPGIIVFRYGETAVGLGDGERLVCRRVADGGTDDGLKRLGIEHDASDDCLGTSHLRNDDGKA